MRTESKVDNDVVSIEVRANITLGIGEIRSGRALWFLSQHLLFTTACERNTYPSVGIDDRGASGDVVGHVGRVAREEPDRDEVVRALHRVPAATVRIERWAVAVGRRRLDSAACVPVRVHVAVVARRGASHCAAGRHCAVCAGVETHRVRRLVIDAFDPEEASESVVCLHADRRAHSL